MLFTREELAQIEDKALKEASVNGVNFFWKKAYERLADAANLVDAMIARTVAQAVKEETEASAKDPT